MIARIMGRGMRTRTYDSASYDLAAYFLAGEPDLNTDAAKITLAVEIQQCIEREIEFMRSMLAKDDEPFPENYST